MPDSRHDFKLAMSAAECHAQMLRDSLPDDTLLVVAEALRVRAMDFVHAYVDNDGESDLAADILRALLSYDTLNGPADVPIFDPAAYGRSRLAVQYIDRSDLLEDRVLTID